MSDWTDPLSAVLAMPSTADIARRAAMYEATRGNRPAPNTLGRPPSMPPTSRGDPISDLYFGAPHVRSPARGEAVSDWPDVTTSDMAQRYADRRHGTEPGSLFGALMGLRDAIPENPDTSWSAANMARAGLGTMANWASMNPSRIGAEELAAPTGMGMMTAPLMRPSAATLGMLVGPTSPLVNRKAYDKATDHLIDHGITRKTVQDVFDKWGLHYDPLSGNVGRYESTADWALLQPKGSGPFSEMVSAPSWSAAYGSLYGAEPHTMILHSDPAKGRIDFTPRSITDVLARGPTPEDRVATIRHEMAGHGSDLMSGRMPGLSVPADGRVASYFRSGTEQSANMAMLAPAYDDLLRSGRMLWGDINPYDPPAGFLPAGVKQTYDDLLDHSPQNWHVTPLDRLLARLGALSAR